MWKVSKLKIKIEFLVLHIWSNNELQGKNWNSAVWHILGITFSYWMVYKAIQNCIIAKSRLSHCGHVSKRTLWAPPTSSYGGVRQQKGSTVTHSMMWTSLKTDYGGLLPRKRCVLLTAFFCHINTWWQAGKGSQETLWPLPTSNYGSLG